jgi:dihydroorotate dehydrogenase (fumarate)
MVDLATKYLGIELANPLVVSPSPLQEEIDHIREMEDSGAAAVVLHSLFEEQIHLESQELDRGLFAGTDSFAESLNYFPDLASVPASSTHPSVETPLRLAIIGIPAASLALRICSR